jgi:hypothetical protein
MRAWATTSRMRLLVSVLGLGLGWSVVLAALTRTVGRARGVRVARLLLSALLACLTWRDALRPQRVVGGTPMALQLAFHAVTGAWDVVLFGGLHLLATRGGGALTNYGLFFTLGLPMGLADTARLLLPCADAERVAQCVAHWLRTPGLLLGLYVWHQHHDDDAPRWVRAVHNVAVVLLAHTPPRCSDGGARVLGSVPIALSATFAVLAPYAYYHYYVAPLRG